MDFNIWIIIAVVLFLIYLYIKYLQSFWKRQKIPYVEPAFIYGNIKPLIHGNLSLGETIRNLHFILKRQGHRFGGIYTFIFPSVLIIDPDLIKDIFIKNFSYFTDRGFHYNEEVDPLSAHLAALNYPQWQPLRQKFSPTFTPAKMRMFCPILELYANKMVTVVEKYAKNNSPVIAKDIASRYTMDNIVNIVLGLKSDTLNDSDSIYRTIGNDFFKPSLRNGFVLSLSLLSSQLMNFFKISITDKNITKHFMDIMRQTVDYREANNIEEKDFMSLLIKLKNNINIDEDNKNENITSGITFNEMAAQAFLFFLVGHETSANLMAFFFYEMSQNMDIQNKLRTEINEVIEKHNGKVTYDTLMDMTYLDCCINETLRKNPTVTTVDRKATKDYVILGSDKIIKKGTKVAASVLGLHHDPEYFPEPEKFDPSRFAEDGSKIIPNTFIPFGLGPRNCIGYRFGQISVKMGLALFIKNFKVSFFPGKKIPTKINPRSFFLEYEGHVWLKVEKM